MKIIKLSLYVVVIFVAVGCGGLTFSQQSLDDNERITKEAIALMQKLDEPYAAHSTATDKLKAYILQVYQREQTRPMNTATVAMWHEVINGKGNLFDLLDMWKTNNTLSPAMTTEASLQVKRLLHSIFDLERYKKKS